MPAPCGPLQRRPLGLSEPYAQLIEASEQRLGLGRALWLLAVENEPTILDSSDALRRDQARAASQLVRRHRGVRLWRFIRPQILHDTFGRIHLPMHESPASLPGSRAE